MPIGPAIIANLLSRGTRNFFSRLHDLFRNTSSNRRFKNIRGIVKDADGSSYVPGGIRGWRDDDPEVHAMLCSKRTSLLLIPKNTVAVNQAVCLVPFTIGIRTRDLEQVLSDHSGQDSVDLSGYWRRTRMSPTTMLVMHLDVDEDKLLCRPRWNVQVVLKNNRFNSGHLIIRKTLQPMKSNEMVRWYSNNPGCIL